MKFITLTIAAVGVAALPQTLQAPAAYTPCGALINNCCKMAPGPNAAKFMDCSVLPGPLPNYVYFIQSCAPSYKIPSCCAEKKSSNLIEGFFNNVLGTNLGESQCVLPPPQP
ncbi:Beta-ketoacyl synthase [Metarhizium robertsii ARSEF 23]|uniref:Beta-ketoacyl synthase n=1 Tax=Metarhizium robertsii (strain ARSEF 23 / ATCC MYA-3075) TaxID=655844 RepID=A0A0B2XFI1_METRA|nr:Beta-ketoacyl synthase [Metarhizium robertsii ARSEF 23]KHO10784.1 Beta-ketoacyl synthase [Metarhizium robertsii ARSEF 23]